MAKRQLTEDFSEFLRFLNEEKVNYLLIGGYAVGFHGHPRTTGDMDVWIAMNMENASRLMKALERFGFVHNEARAELFLEPGNVVRFRWPPMRIEVLNQIDGVDFDECYRRRVFADFGDLEVPVISLEDLLKNKEATGREQDAADVKALSREQPKKD
ncbi:MAG: hypothetical protein AAGA58_07610 [Verrucomicrobiota bacterium]